MSPRNNGVQRRSTVQSIERSLDLLEALALSSDGMGIKELSDRVSLHASTVHRLLGTLLTRGYVQQNDQTGRYSIGPRTLQLANAFHNHSDIRQHAHPVLRRLMETSGETANLVIRDGNGAVYIDQVQSPRLVRMFAIIGRRVPLHSTACGKAFLAFLDPAERTRLVKASGLPASTRFTITNPRLLDRELAEICKRGYAEDDQEHDEGVRCLASPVFDSIGNVIAALSISGPTSRITKEQMPVLGRLVAQAAANLSTELGYIKTS